MTQALKTVADTMKSSRKIARPTKESPLKIVYETPPLNALTSTGKPKYWVGVVLEDEAGNCYRTSRTWSRNTGGESSTVVEAIPHQVTPKNVGRSNETTAREQAILEIDAKLLRQIDKGYAREGEAAEAGNGYVLPMLAHPWEKRKHRVEYPLLVQPKYDGVRMMYRSDKGHWSRQGKAYIPEVVAHITVDTQGWTLDGELILPDGDTFQATVKAVKKYRPGVSENLRYRVYDVADHPGGTVERQALLDRLFDSWAGLEHPLIRTPTAIVETEQELFERHAEFVSHGYEGTMVRAREGRYTAGQRGDSLLKLKDFMDDEFVIVGFTDGGGKDAGTVIFECRVGENTFRVRPEGTVEERSQMFQEGESYIGKPLTVRFQRYSDDGVPIFPVGVGLRELA